MIFACDVCLEPMRARDIEKHKRGAHAEVMARAAEYEAAMALQYVKVAAAPILILTALLLLLVFSLSVTDPRRDVAVAILVDAMFGTAFVGVLYARRSTFRTPNPLDEVVIRCWICYELLRRGDMRKHLSAVHSPYASYLRLSVFVVYGFLLGSIGVLLSLLNLLLFRVLPESSWNLVPLVALAPFAGFAIGALPWASIGHPRYVRRSRERWQRQHQTREG